MGDIKSNNKGVFLIVGILIALTVLGSFVDAGTVVNDEGFRHLRF
ncbi:hypothetical protein [Peribacillus faecalis]|nr:hypothetical protein [Peribacillus faecalis]